MHINSRLFVSNLLENQSFRFRDNRIRNDTYSHKTRLILVLLLCCFYSTVISAEQISLTYKQAIQKASKNHPEIKQADANYRRKIAASEQEGRFLNEAPELQVSITQGTSREAIEAGGLPQTLITQGVDRKLKGIEAGISQKVDLAGQTTLRSETAKSARDLAEIEREMQQQLILSDVGQSYFLAATTKEWIQHLKTHTYRLGQLQRRTGGNYTDKRLGRYGAVALNSGIASMVSHRLEMESSYDELEMKLKIFTGISSGSKLELEKPSTRLPDIPPLQKLLDSATDNSYEKRIQKAKLVRAQNERKKAYRNLFPSPTLFLFAGRESMGRDDTFTGVPSESQDYIRFGMSFPIEALGPNYENTSIQTEGEKFQEIEYRQLESNLDHYIRIQYRIYNNEKKRLKIIQPAHDQMEKYLPLLENALLTRRISFFEFWGEHERYHNLFETMIEARMKAFDSLKKLELLTGMDLDQSGLWAEGQ